MYYSLYRQQTDVILLDFAKAFDSVPHQRLLLKLRHYGVTYNTCHWICSWLTKRSRWVVLDGVQSDPVFVQSGVPQGTVLGPLMFLLYINDIADVLSSSLRLFADDCLLYRTINSEEDYYPAAKWFGSTICLGDKMATALYCNEMYYHALHQISMSTSNKL